MKLFRAIMSVVSRNRKRAWKRRSSVRDFTIDELQTGGWIGRATVDLMPHLLRPSDASGAPSTPGEAWATVNRRGLLPGRAIVLELLIGRAGDEGNIRRHLRRHRHDLLRTWPSVITDFQAMYDSDAWVGEIEFCDPLTYFSSYPIWGVFRDTSPSEIFGAAMTLATGSDDRPTLEPVLESMPIIKIKQQSRSSLERLPYAIAAGEPLGLWLLRLCSSLGLQIQLLGKPKGSLEITLRDSRQHNLKPVSLQLSDGESKTPIPVSATHATVNSLRLSSHLPSRGSLLDNQVTGDIRHLGAAGPVESVLTAAHLGVEEASIRSSYQGEKSSINLASLKIVCAQPGLLPGRLVTFTNQSVLGAKQWQVVNVTHLFNQSRFRNIVVLAKDGYPVRLPRVDADAPLTVSAFIDDGVSEKGKIIARDRLGRIPVRFMYGFIPTSNTGSLENIENKDRDEDSSDAISPTSQLNGADSTEGSAVIHLPLVEPMAGAQHGFVPTHRQGDFCRVSLHSPTYAEIVGFVYGENRKLGIDVSEASAGMVVRQQKGDWEGLGFWPDEDLDDVFQEGDDE